MPTTQDLTFKQRNWLKHYIETGNATEAARRSYNCNDDSARAIGSENLAKINISELMEEAGLTDARLTKVHYEGLEANRIHGTNDNFIEIPDWQARAKYLELAYKLKKRLGADSQTNIQVNVTPILGGKSKEENEKEAT